MLSEDESRIYEATGDNWSSRLGSGNVKSSRDDTSFSYFTPLLVPD
jgi:hypothetical protein